ncbi:MAG: hypothetical protein GXP45_04985 [bacterium]|nr:hypothetical protein [bacterium]
MDIAFVLVALKVEYLINPQSRMRSTAPLAKEPCGGMGCLWIVFNSHLFVFNSFFVKGVFLVDIFVFKNFLIIMVSPGCVAPLPLRFDYNRELGKNLWKNKEKAIPDSGEN